MKRNTRAISTRRPFGQVEQLEPRKMLACDVVAAEYEISLLGEGVETGQVNYESECEHGNSQVSIEVSVKNAEPGSVHDVAVDGVIVGSLQVDAKGSGKLELSNEAGDAELPADFPGISADSHITVGSILSGSIGGATSHTDSSSDNGESGDEGSDDGSRMDDPSTDGLSTDDSSDDLIIDDDDDDIGGTSDEEDESGDDHGTDVSDLDDNSDDVAAGRDISESEDDSSEQAGGWDVDGVDAVLGSDDGDGEPDDSSMANASSQIASSNSLYFAGDVNGDGRFDSSDLVEVFQRGEYRDDAVGNSTWQSGDWNGDGEFDTDDLVLAMQLGHYRD